MTIDRMARSLRFRRLFAEAMGLSSLAGLAALGAACGDSASGSGTSGSGGGSTTTASSTASSTTSAGVTNSGSSSATSSSGSGGGGGAGGGGCMSKTPGAVLKEVCLPAPDGGACLPATDPSVGAAIAVALQLCDATQGVPACCNMPAVTDVPCGPTGEPMCCYQAGTVTALMCGIPGRPFAIAGEVRAAGVRARSDWQRPAAPRIEGLDATTRRALGELWTRDARYEHASVASFARLALELLAVGAPAELVRDAQRGLGDEIRHAEVGFALASVYAGSPVGPGPLAMEGAELRTTLAELAAAAVREGCIGETIAALAAAEARDQAEDEAVRAALAGIAEDEAEHAAMAFRLVAWALRSGGAEVREAVTAAFAAPVDWGSEEAPAGIDAAAFAAHGGLLPEARRAIGERALGDVIAPSAAVLLARC